jgi:hypothetical protein
MKQTIARTIALLAAAAFGALGKAPVKVPALLPGDKTTL